MPQVWLQLFGNSFSDIIKNYEGFTGSTGTVTF